MEETATNGAASRQQVSQTVIAIICALLASEVGDVREDTELEGELGLDSIHRVELSTRISDTYGISVGVDDLDLVDTFGELVDAVIAATSSSAAQQAG